VKTALALPANFVVLPYILTFVLLVIYQADHQVQQRLGYMDAL
jgi:hypothetical protein